MNSIPAVTFPIAYFLIFYGLFVVFYLIWSAFNVYHLVRFGVAGWHLKALVGIYGAGSVALLGISLLALSGYDWSVPFSLTDFFLNGGVSNTLFL